jgi:hypothetical protein
MSEYATYNDALPGDWGPDVWADAGGYTANNGPQVVANDVLTQSTTTKGEDKYSGWFQALAGNVVNYAIQRDAAKNGLIPQRAANGQPIYTNQAQPPAYMGTASSAGGMSMGGLLVIGAAVLGAVFLVAKKG